MSQSIHYNDILFANCEQKYQKNAGNAGYFVSVL